jgi:hypothetical protein
MFLLFVILKILGVGLHIIIELNMVVRILYKTIY